MIKVLISTIQRFQHTERGGILVFVGISLLPLLLMVGLAVDTSIGLGQKRKLQMAVDAAAKSGAVDSDGQLSTVTAAAQRMFAVNTTNMKNISGPNINYNPTGQTVTVSASIVVPTTFMALGGINSLTYSATSTAGYSSSGSEVAIVIDMSMTTGNWTLKMIDSLQLFVNNLPSTTLVSIVPITTQVLLDAATTNPGALFNHLSNTTNDESSNPALYALSGNYAWNSTNYGNVYNYLYGTAFPTSTGYYPVPGTCTGWGGPGTYSACAALYPALCSAGHTSCRANYSYTNYRIPAILPLTLNRSLISAYLASLKNFSTVDNGVFTSLLVWGWRAIAPEWKDFWLVNSKATTTTRASGNYPVPYALNSPKNIILAVTGAPHWSATSIANNYNSACSTGNTNWFMTAYGAFPKTSDKSAQVDITCDNYNYKTIDKTLGLNTATTSYYDQSKTSTAYAAQTVTEVAAKYQRICSSIKAKNINLYVITQTDDADLQKCASSTASPFYQVSGNGTAHIDISATNVTIVSAETANSGTIAVVQK